MIGSGDVFSKEIGGGATRNRVLDIPPTKPSVPGLRRVDIVL